MRINTNVGSLNAQKNLFNTQRDVDSSMAKLSSGLRISRAADDAAGLSIANKLRSSTRGLQQAANNAQQGNAMLQIAEGSASTIQRILERQNELYVQSQSTGIRLTLALFVMTIWLSFAVVHFQQPHHFATGKTTGLHHVGNVYFQ